MICNLFPFVFLYDKLIIVIVVVVYLFRSDFESNRHTYWSLAYLPDDKMNLRLVLPL